MRISDWSSDVCSSDLPIATIPRPASSTRPSSTCPPTLRPLLPVALAVPPTPPRRTASSPTSIPTSSASLPVSAPCATWRSEEHTSELQSLMRISYAVFCLKKKKKKTHMKYRDDKHISNSNHHA